MTPIGLRAPERLLAFIRVGIALTILARTTPLLPGAFAFSGEVTPLLGWPRDAPGLGPMPDPLVQFLCVMRTALAIGMAVGPWARACAVGCAVCGLAVFIEYPLDVHYTLLLLYQAALLLALAESNVALSLRRATPREAAPDAVESSLWLLRWFVVSVYFWAGSVKLQPDWLAGVTLRGLATTGALLPSLSHQVLDSSAVAMVLSWAVALIELGLVALLLLERTRFWGFAIAVAFHCVLEVLTRPDLLGVGMIVLLLAFLPRGRVARCECRPL